LFGDDVVHVTLHSDNDINGVPVTIYSQNELGDPSKLLVDIHLPNGDVLTDSFHWTTPAFRSDRASSLSAPVTEPGNYSFRIKNNNQWDWDGSMMVTIQLQHFEKPCFYWGVAGFIIALGYVALVTVSTIKTRHRNWWHSKSTLFTFTFLSPQQDVVSSRSLNARPNITKMD
jgi:hypothetical protein